ncbi:hypothetical protein H0H92_008453, partial [Tricholoma furcatifolium]
MNYIFNNFSTGSADGPVFGPRRRMRTEPHPADDLNSYDIAHRPPARVRRGVSKLCAETSKEDKVLRFMGVVDVEGGIVKAGLENHPVATSLGSSDNIMSHTER